MSNLIKKSVLAAVFAVFGGLAVAFGANANLAFVSNNESTGDATISFDQTFAGAGGTAVYRANAVNMAYVEIARLEPGVDTFVDTAMRYGVVYSYRVAPVDANDGVGAMSDDAVQAMRVRRIERDPAVSNSILRDGMAAQTLIALNNEASAAFDGDTGTFCEHWLGPDSNRNTLRYAVIGIDFGEPYHICRYRMTSSNVPARINGSRVYGVNDTAAWTAAATSDSQPDLYPARYEALRGHATPLCDELVFDVQRWYEFDCDYSGAWRYAYVWGTSTAGDEWGFAGDCSEIQYFGWADSDVCKLDIVDAARDGDMVAVTVTLDSKLAGYGLYAVSASTIAGLDQAAETPIGGAIAADEGFRHAAFGVASGDRYVCVRAKDGDDTVETEVYAIADMPERPVSAPAAILGEVVPAADGADFSILLASVGAGAEDADVVFAYGYSADALDYEIVCTNGAAAGVIECSAGGLRPGASYYAAVSVENNLGVSSRIGEVFALNVPEEPPTAGVNMEPFIYQARVFGNNWAVGFDILGSSDLGKVTGCYALHYNNYTPWTVTFPDGTTQQATWTDNVTFGYTFWMHFDAAEYAFTGVLDDNCNVYVSADADELGTLVLANWYGARDTRTWTCPAAGLYKVTIYCGNGSGGFGAYAGIPGASWRKTSDTAGEWQENGVWWRTFTDAYGERFFNPSAPAAVVSELRNGTRVSALAQFPNGAVGGTMKVYWAPEYAGADVSGWTELAGDFGTLADSGAGDFTFTLPAGAAYVRYATAKDGATYWSDARPVAEIAAVDASRPSYTFSSVSDVTCGGATLNGTIIACGGEHATCDVVVEYGYLSDELEFVREFSGKSEGLVSVALAGLAPERRYYVRVYVRNASGDESDKSETVSLATTAMPAAGDSEYAGLWEAHSTAGWINDVADVGVSNRVLQTYAADMYYGGTQLHWPGWNDRGEAITVDGAVACYYLYMGYIFLEDRDYYVFTDVDDHAWMFFNGTTVYDAARTWGANKIDVSEMEWWTGPGWYRFALETQDGGGGAGPWDGKSIGAGWNTNNYTTVDTSANWHYFRDPGDGSFLRITPPVRGVTVDSYTVSDGRFTAELSLSPWQTGDTGFLGAAYGMDCAGATTNDWDSADIIAAITTNDTAVSYTGPAGAHDTYCYVRFFTVDEGGAVEWCTPPYYAPDVSRPAFDASGVSYDPQEGDAITVSGTVLSAGAGLAADLVVEISACADMSDAQVWNCGACAANSSFSFRMFESDVASSRYIAPGRTYYLRAKLVGDGGKTDVADVQQVTTPAAAAFASALANDVNAEVSFYGAVSPLGAGERPWVYVYAGFDRNAMDLIGRQQVDEAGNYGVKEVFDHVRDTLYYRYVVSNSCNTAVWTAQTDEGSIYVRDQYTYRWKPSVHEGAWNDPANWVADGNPPQATYPDGSACAAVFDTDDTEAATPYRVTLGNGYFGVAYMYFWHNGLKIAIEGVGYGDEVNWTADHGANVPSGIYHAGGWPAMSDNVDVTFRNMYINTQGMQSSNGDKITLDHVYHDCWNSCYFHGDPMTVVLTNSAVWVQRSGHFHSNASNMRLKIADSVVWGSGGGVLNFAYDANAYGDQIVEFFGATPYIEMADSVFHVSTSGHYYDVNAKMIFHVPEGGYGNRHPLGVYNSVFYRTGDVPLSMEVAPDSPALKAGKSTMMIADSVNGFNSQYIEFPEQRRATWSYAADGKSLLLSISSSGTVIYVK